MEEVKFDYHRVNSRKDLLHFVEEYGDERVLEKIGQNPQAWLEELQILGQMLNNDSLGSSLVGINFPPVKEQDFRELSKNVFLYRGKFSKLRGLWIKEHVSKNLEKIIGKPYEWKHFKVGTRAELKVNHEFSEVPFEQFLPENFEQNARPVEKSKGFNKRPLFTFPVESNQGEIKIYAKGEDFSLSRYFESSKPSYRLTPIAGISRTTSKTEMETTLNIRNLGVKVPRVVGHYESPMEEFLFLEEVPGKHPDEVLEDNREEIIKQDAEMLANLCLSGYRKEGFTDFDDKVFDGKNLYLIDVDECMDIYFPFNPNFREVLLNSKDTKKLQDFRQLQKELFVGTMRDAIFNYRGTLTPTESDQKEYVSAFYERMNWNQPNKSELREMLHFPNDYMPKDLWINLMCDTG